MTEDILRVFVCLLSMLRMRSLCVTESRLMTSEMTYDDVRLPAANHKKYILFLPIIYGHVCLRGGRTAWIMLETDTHTMATGQDIRAGCVFTYSECIAKFFEKSSVAVNYLREHGVLPQRVECPNCKLPCKLIEDRHQWHCGRYRVLSKRNDLPAPSARPC